MLYSPKEFIKSRPMYVLNTSKRKQVTMNERTNVKIIVDFTEIVPANTICYIILIA